MNTEKEVTTAIETESLESNTFGIPDRFIWMLLLFKRESTKERLRAIKYYDDQLQRDSLSSEDRKRYEDLRITEVNALHKDEIDFEKNALKIIGWGFGFLTLNAYINNPEKFVHALESLSGSIDKLIPRRLVKA